MTHLLQRRRLCDRQVDRLDSAVLQHPAPPSDWHGRSAGALPGRHDSRLIRLESADTVPTGRGVSEVEQEEDDEEEDEEEDE